MMTIRTRGTSGGRVARVVALALAAWLAALAGCAGDDPEVAEASAPVAVTGAEDQACFQGLQELEASLLDTAAEARASSGCKVDRDCALVDLSVACLDACPTAVPAGLAAETRARAASLGDEVCTPSRRCAMHSTCPPIRRAACVSGQCVADVTAWTNR